MATSFETRGLTADALSKLPLAGSHKDSLTKAFVASQRQHVSAYAKEGKQIISRWNEDSSIKSQLDGVSPKASNPNLVTGGFSSPILKPRNPKAPSLIEGALDVSPATRENDTSKDLNKGKRRTEERSKVDPKRDNEVTARQSETKGKEKSKPAAKDEKKRRRMSESDDEREERLAQRRERRRRKKEITAPKEKRQTEDSDQDGNAEDPNAFNKKKPTSKNTKSKLPAGLALMHGFSAKNIGSRRLTVGPMVTSGVFNKGRASIKTKVQKQKSKVSTTFDEVNFLNKVKPPSASCGRPKSPKPSSSTASSDTGDLSVGLGGSARQKSKLPKNSMPHSSTDSKTSAESVTDPSVSEDKSNYASEVWEIEKEFMCSEVNGQATTALSKQRSIIIDSRTWDWGVPEASKRVDNGPGVPVVTYERREIDITASKRSCVASVISLTPSQSASQMHIRPVPVVDCRQLRSKFFASPRQSKYPEENLSTDQQDLPPTAERDITPRPRGEQNRCSDSSVKNSQVEVTAKITSHGEAELQAPNLQCEGSNVTDSWLNDAIQQLEADDEGMLNIGGAVLPSTARLSVLGTDLSLWDCLETNQTSVCDVGLRELDATLIHSGLDFHAPSVGLDILDICSEYAMEHARTEELIYYDDDSGAWYSDVNDPEEHWFEKRESYVLQDVYSASSNNDNEHLAFTGDQVTGSLSGQEELFQLQTWDYTDQYSEFDKTPWSPPLDTDDWEESSFSQTCDEYHHLAIDVEINESPFNSDVPVARNSILRSTLSHLYPLTVSTTQIGSLEEAEATVAKDFQKSFYPVKY
ncbi:uncharacterized protein FOMMEDRAFT_158471 [Fomitiporia mediterranea MF3/22]|uniref:uncharacterized protein n=1 Tax=Fomitiporia mediterranea (strain MF3/22) TaxID=694068 RepID=UPI0004408493|nr:uncharacterized protein FOMMEDRAFT_158471 [Fomitiporia mediterranea MF3/22]EJD01338.1 hypothetical protein FOMMEDRAFT_158471 [Fomitiporia mediterranea MF3/22]